MSPATEIGLAVAAIGVEIRLLAGADSMFVPYYAGLVAMGLLIPLAISVRNRFLSGSRP